MTFSGTHEECEPVRLSLGAFVLGALTTGESFDVRHHLAACPNCRQEYDELAGVPQLLGLVSKAEAEAVCSASASAAAPVPSQCMPLGRLRRRGRRRRNRRGTMVAAVLGVSVLAGIGTTWSLSGGGQAAPAHVASATDGTTGVGASVSVQPVAWGSRLTLALHNAPPGSSCSLVAVGRHGERQVAASWTAKYRGNLTIPGAIAMSPGDVSRFDVETFDGHRLVSVPE
ncbi:zf-HC2 domain-containing protein [Streptantibioticus ferralitis]|uniref:Zf-HC2 domain-containing protein n=1 Tax=Streptantibioticus ferralitis TaxID=236510 RepID=A0ABT5YZ80_9ACTN|nr:zf-HC2 domain-containing protein [Streptantibioticus ferralitis]MDF2256095.1 zf-HC2 domain-containing protein [Streptantibioticus ferralitis]